MHLCTLNPLSSYLRTLIISVLSPLQSSPLSLTKQAAFFPSSETIVLTMRNEDKTALEKRKQKTTYTTQKML